MASCIQKSCCNFSRFSITSTSMFMPKMCLKCPQGTGLLPNTFKRKIHISNERTFSSLFTRGVSHMRPCVKWIHITRTQRGIEEFFPPGILESPQPLPEEVKSGRSWRAAELRQKSNEDLHKLWYVLLKERNMLLTVQEEAQQLEVVMPSPERLHKVKKSMAMIKVVLDERKRAVEAIERSYKNAEKDVVQMTGNHSADSKDGAGVNNSETELRQLPITI